MARHVWLIKRFGQETHEPVLAAIRLMLQDGIDFAQGCRWLGYSLEQLRQKGVGCDLHQFMHDLWCAVQRSKHRYARGRNCANYETAGRRMLQLLAPTVGLTADAPPEMVWDSVQEKGLPC